MSSGMFIMGICDISVECYENTSDYWPILSEYLHHDLTFSYVQQNLLERHLKQQVATYNSPEEFSS